MGLERLRGSMILRSFLLMKFKSLTVLACLTAVILLGGCVPSSRTPLDEEKEPYYVTGLNAVKAMDNPEAIKSFEKAIEVNPQSGAAHLQLGLLYENDPKTCVTAIYHYDKFLALRPTSHQAQIIRQRITGCKQEIAKSVALAPQSRAINNQLESMALKTQQLTIENRRLVEENSVLKTQLAQLDPKAQVSPSENGVRNSEPRLAAWHSAPSAPGRGYTVQSGDTFYSIAKRHNISQAALQSANPGVEPTRLRIDQRLTLPSR